MLNKCKSSYPDIGQCQFTSNHLTTHQHFLVDKQQWFEWSLTDNEKLVLLNKAAYVVVRKIHDTFATAVLVDVGWNEAYLNLKTTLEAFGYEFS